MYLTGVVAEFNPFHNGHKYLLEKVRENGATHIVAAMSGDAVQRGETAVCSKHERAENAVKNGADLVVELPAPWSCSAAEYFAGGAVSLLCALGVDALAFGSETDDAALIRRAADAVDELSECEDVRRLTAEGKSYPSALCEAAKAHFGEQTAQVIASPNSTLAVEYVRALGRQGSKADIIPIKRVGAAHDSVEGASGSNLRSLIAQGCDISAHVPSGCIPNSVSPSERAWDILYYGLLTAEREQLLKLPEVSEPLADIIIKARRDPSTDFGEFLMAVKSKRFTLARIRRSALHLALGVTKADFEGQPPYLRVLSFSERGAEILRRFGGGLPLSTSLRDLERSSEQAAHIIAIENRAVRLRQMCENSRSFQNEYSRKIVLNKK